MHVAPDPATVLPEPDYPLVTNMFLSRASQTPDHPALCQNGAIWTYRRLAESCHTLAGELIDRGMKKGNVVAVIGPGSFGLVSSMMAVLLGGGVVLPVDQNLPARRRHLMVDESGARYVLHIRDSTNVPEEWAGRGDQSAMILVDRDTGYPAGAERFPGGRALNLPNLSPEDPAYIFFTSGTTDVPKGVLGCHKGLSHFLVWQRDTFAVGSQDRCAQLTNLSFDVVLRDIFLPLISGATICLPDGSDERSFDKVLPWMERERITLLHSVPSLAQSWLKHVPEGVTLHTLRYVFFAGEALTDALVQKWREAFPDSGRAVNLYGPTETTLAKFFYEIPSTMSQGLQPVGKPLPHTQALVLSDNLEQCGIGQTGEIFLRTPYRTLGYINDPAEQQKRFIRNPFRSDPKDILYRTGDRGRYRPDGLLEVLGRLDDQVKIRGVRVEPNEVSAVLSRHPKVISSAVIGRKNSEGENVLAAYVVPSSRQGGVSPSELRSSLSGQLPGAMVPSSFMILDSLPLTPNGKIDRNALPAPYIERPDLENAFAGPRTPIEELLADIWCEVLGLRTVGIHDNFFELGGHSLLATQVISRLRYAFQVEIPLQRLFETPTVAGLTEAVSATLIAKERQSAPPIVPVPREGGLPLSFAQERLWFLDQLEPGNPAYTIASAIRLRGSLNVAALEQSFSEIMRRHEVLRTTFVTKNDQAVQRIAPAGAFTLPQRDLGTLPEEQREAEVQIRAREETYRPFDLASGPLLRAVLLRLKPEEHVLLLTVHHIVSDGWSMGILYRELSLLYEAFLKGNPAPLPELPIQYADFAVWQRQWLQGGNLEKQLNFWKEHLEGVSLLELPTNHSRPSVQTFRGATHVVQFPASLTEALQGMSRKEGVTLFMTLLAAFQNLLHRYTGQDDIAVGTPIASRNCREIEGLIGFFVNTLVMRTDTSGNPVFRELLRSVRKATLDAYAHQDLPFEKLVEELHPERDLSRNPLFQVMFALQNASTFAPQLSGLMVIPMEIENTRTRFDLEVHLSETSEGLKGAFVCNTDLFDAATIERMAGHYQRMLEGIAANPDQRLSELPLLTEAEQHKLLREWNDTSTEYPKDLCIHELFEKQAERTPDAIAVIFGDRQLTYRELNSRANQLGNYLRKQGVGAEVLVGICVERSMEMVIGILGILKAGGAYVPLDPAYPEERLNFMIEDTRTPVILTQRELLEVLPGHAAKTICLDSDWKMIARESKGKPASGTTAGSLAYVMYTSGSTGRPKGVCVLHRAVIRLVLNTNYMKLEPSDIVAQASSFSFDASVLEIWGALLTGARLVGIDKEIVLSPRDLASQILKQRVSVLFLTTALFNHVAREAPASFRSVKNLLFGGEAADPRCAEMVMKAGPPGRLLNLYGPTESTVVTTWYRVEYIPGDATTIPIGKPVSNTTVYVLDNNLHPVPTGVPGELYVGGDALARGYLNRPEMTAEKFIPDPFSEEPGARLYKTGDMVRYLPDGNIEFLGRTDHQVKLRGFRIELEEIKAVLGQHPDVRETVVITRGDQPGEKRLVAYVVMNRTSNTTTDQLREFLREKLPDYMVPSSFVVLDSLPLTPNGKIDWTALPAANRFIPGPGKNFLAPRNALELQLAGIWEKILGVKPVGVRDNFFELGGHSLLAGRLVAEINRMTGQNLPLIAIFQSPTVEQLCEMFAGEDRSGQLSSLVPIQTAGTKQPFYWVCSGTSVLWRYFDADQPLYVLLDQGLDGKPVRHTTVEEIAAHYLKEIRTVQPEGPYSLGGYSFGGIAALEIAQKLCREGEEVSLLFLIEPPENSFPLAKPGNASSSGNDSFHSRLNYHKKNLALLPPGDRIVYILSKLSSVLDWIKARTWIPAERKIKMAICKISLFVGHPIPLSLRNPYLMDIYKKALRGYTPQVYPGKVVLCHSDKVRYSSQSELKCVAAGGVDVFKVQGAGHLEIVKEPYAEKCARHLKEWLNEVQAKKEDRQV